MSLMSSFSSVQYVLLVFTWIVCEMGDKWPCSCSFLKCWFQYLFKIPCSIFVWFLFFFSMGFVQVVHLHSITHSATDWNKYYFILLDWSNFYMSDYMSIAIHSFARYILTSLSGDEILLTRYVNLFTNFRGLLLNVEMAPCLKPMNSFNRVHVEANGIYSFDPCDVEELRLERKVICSCASITVTADHRQLFVSFFSANPFSLIWSIYVGSAQCM